MKPGLAQRLGAQGRDGDTLVAHISPLEAAILKLLGGSGTRNPKTGLLEFKYGGDTNEGGAHGFGGRASMGGHAGNGRSQAIGTGIKDNTGLGDADVDRLAAGPSFSSPGFSVTRNRTIGNVGLSQADIDKLAAGPDFQDPSFGGEIDRTHRDMDAYGHSVMDMASWAAFNHEFADEADENGETFLDKLANGLLNHVLSIQERAIFDPADPMRTSAQWGFDAPGFIGGLIGNRLAGPAGGAILGAAASELAREMGNFGFVKFSSFGQGSNQNSSGSSQVSQGAGPGNLNDVIARIAAARNGIRTGAGVQPPSPTIPTALAPPSGMPSGLFGHLSQNPGQLAGYSGSSRFGVGAVAPIPYLRPVA